MTHLDRQVGHTNAWRLGIVREGQEESQSRLAYSRERFQAAAGELDQRSEKRFVETVRRIAQARPQHRPLKTKWRKSLDLCAAAAKARRSCRT
jgi:hypothetical protein